MSFNTFIRGSGCICSGIHGSGGGGGGGVIKV